MQPEQSQPATNAQLPPEPSKHGMPKWVWFVIGGVVVLLGGFVYLIALLLNMSTPGSSPTGQATPLTKLTIGAQPYVYPCSVATEADYARIFHLDADKVGTVEEESALPPGEITASTSDLTKIAPSLRDRYVTSCTYTLAKKGASRMSRIEVGLEQYSSEKEAAANYSSKRTGDAGDFTLDGVDNGTRQLAKLPSFTTTSYVRLPDADSVFPGVKAVVLIGTRLVSLQYNFGTGETTDTILPLIDDYAKSIQVKLADYKEGKPADLTGRTTFLNTKFVDVCTKVDAAKLGSAFANIELRPDEATRSSTYGSLDGSHAAEDGVVSYCKFNFSTPASRESQAPAADTNGAKKGSSLQSTLSSDEKWPYDLTLTVNSQRSPADALAYFAAKKARLAVAVPNFGTPTITDITGVGDKAYKLHKEYAQATLHSGQNVQKLFLEDTFVVASGSDVITISLQQTSQPSAPGAMTVKEAQQKKAFELIRDILKDNRK